MTKRLHTFLVSDLIRHSGFVIRICAYLCAAGFICGSNLACDRSETSKKQIVLYTSIDEPIARPIIEQFEKQTGIDVVIVTDTEANKSIGLAEKLRAEKDRPRCDVWWGNEPFHTINLGNEGLFQPYDSPSAADVPAMYRDPAKRWAGNGLRARILIYSGLVTPDAAIDQLANLARDRAAMARPTAGTTGGHVAALYSSWGDAKADAFFRSLAASRITLLGGNGAVAESVADGKFAVGLTDNDDFANLEPRRGTVSWMLPDQNGSGTLMIPTTVALVANRPESADAKRLIDYLLSKETEQELIRVKFAGWSIRGGEGQPKAMQIDYVEVAKKMPEAVRRATAILEGREP